MFKHLYLLIVLIGPLSQSTAQAAVELELDSPSGAIKGLPGAAIGWGFTLRNTENYLIVTSADFESATTMGRFTDLISAPDNFFVVGPELGGSNVWVQTYDEGSQTGLGSFTIDPGVATGSVAYGNIVLTYDLFSQSPLNPLFNPDTDTLSNGNVLTANASITAVVPVPAAVWLFGSAMLSLIGFGNRKKCWPYSII